MKIVQMSDIHVGSGLFRPDLLSAVVEETNALEPDLVAVAGDLTTEGYRWEFEEAKGYLDRIECPNVVVIPGNHDARNVGYRHFEEFFGMREGTVALGVPEGEAKVVAIERELRVDMVLSAHRHVPYVWSISGVRIVHSGTASSMRVRGTMPPSYNVIEFDEESVRITLQQPGKGKEGEEPLASFSRKPVTTSEFYPDFERFVIYDRLPFLTLGTTNSPPA